MRPWVLVLACCAADPAARDRLPDERNADALPREDAPAPVDTRPAPEPAAEAAAECTAIIAAAPAPLDCATTHGLMFCAGKGPNGCVLCPTEALDGGFARRLDCDQNAANGCEVVEDEQNCGACGQACGAGQRCVSRWAAAPAAFAPHCE